ncbi:hypothetical protein [Aquisalibacillus elongatus]|nr:hypothetical protein [Aquisalibacillus elongatus]
MISNSAKIGMGAAMGYMMRHKTFRKNRFMKRMRKTGKRLRKQYL